MCVCTPGIRTPFCGRYGCKSPRALELEAAESGRRPASLVQVTTPTGSVWVRPAAVESISAPYRNRFPTGRIDTVIECDVRNLVMVSGSRHVIADEPDNLQKLGVGR